MSSGSSPRFANPISVTQCCRGLQLLPLRWGLTTGFVFLWIVRHAVPTRLVRIITLMLAGSSTSAVFTYIFIDSLRVSVLYRTLGTVLGIRLHIVLFPTSIAYISPLVERRERFPADAVRKPMAKYLVSSGATTSDAGGPGERPFDSQPHERRGRLNDGSMQYAGGRRLICSR